MSEKDPEPPVETRIAAGGEGDGTGLWAEADLQGAGWGVGDGPALAPRLSS